MSAPGALRAVWQPVTDLRFTRDNVADGRDRRLEPEPEHRSFGNVCWRTAHVIVEEYTLMKIDVRHTST